MKSNNKNDNFDFNDDAFLNEESDFNFDDLEKYDDAGPAKKAAKLVFGTGKAVGKGAMQGIKMTLDSEVNGFSEAYDTVTGIGKTVGEGISEAFDEGKKAMTTMKRIGLNMLPMTKKVVPKGVYDNVEGWLKKNLPDLEEEKSEEEKAKQAEDEQISSTITDVFKASQKLEGARALAEANDRQIGRMTTQFNHKQMMGVVSSIDRRTHQISNFLGTTYTSFLKKDLELKYRGYFIARDTLKYVKGMSGTFEQKLESIKINTGLPDVIKVNYNEKLKAQKRGAKGSAREFMNNFNDNLKKTIKEKLSGGLKSLNTDYLPMFQSMTEMMGDMGGMMAPSKMDIANSILGLGTKFATRLFFGKAMNDNPTLKMLGDLLSGDTKSFMSFFHKGANGLKRKLADGPLGFLADFIPGYSDDNSMSKHKSASDPEGGAVFDNLVHDSITLTIPKHLERIGDTLDAVAKAMDVKVDTSVQKSFDRITGRLDYNTEIVKRAKERAMGSEEEQAEFKAKQQKIVESMFKASRGMDQKADLSKDKDFAKIAEKMDDIGEALSRAGANLEFIDPSVIKKFISGDTEDLTYADTDYLDKVFGDRSKESIETAKVLMTLMQDQKGRLNIPSSRAINELSDIYENKKERYDKEMQALNISGQAHLMEAYGEDSYGGRYINRDKMHKDLVRKGKRGDIVKRDKTGKETVRTVEDQDRSMEWDGWNYFQNIQKQNEAINKLILDANETTSAAYKYNQAGLDKKYKRVDENGNEVGITGEEYFQEQLEKNPMMSTLMGILGKNFTWFTDIASWGADKTKYMSDKFSSAKDKLANKFANLTTGKDIATISIDSMSQVSTSQLEAYVSCPDNEEVNERLGRIPITIGDVDKSKANNVLNYDEAEKITKEYLKKIIPGSPKYVFDPSIKKDWKQFKDEDTTGRNTKKERLARSEKAYRERNAISEGPTVNGFRGITSVKDNYLNSINENVKKIVELLGGTAYATPENIPSPIGPTPTTNAPEGLENDLPLEGEGGRIRRKKTKLSRKEKKALKRAQEGAARVARKVKKHPATPIVVPDTPVESEYDTDADDLRDEQYEKSQADLIAWREQAAKNTVAVKRPWYKKIWDAALRAKGAAFGCKHVEAHKVEVANGSISESGEANNTSKPEDTSSFSPEVKQENQKSDQPDLELIKFEGDAESLFHKDFRTFANKVLTAIMSIPRGFGLPGLGKLGEKVKGAMSAAGNAISRVGKGLWNRATSLAGSAKHFIFGNKDTGEKGLLKGTKDFLFGNEAENTKGLIPGAFGAGKNLLFGNKDQGTRGIIGGTKDFLFGNKDLNKEGIITKTATGAKNFLFGNEAEGKKGFVQNAYNFGKHTLFGDKDKGTRGIVGGTSDLLFGNKDLGKKGLIPGAAEGAKHFLFGNEETGDKGIFTKGKEKLKEWSDKLSPTMKDWKANIFGGVDSKGKEHQNIIRRTTTAIKNFFGIGKGPTYVDIYRKDKLDLGAPLLKIAQQEAGVFFADGSGRVQKSADINKPVVDKDNNTLISQEDINAGLVDKEGASIYDPKKSFISKILGGAKKFFGKITKKVSGFISGFLDSKDSDKEGETRFDQQTFLGRRLGFTPNGPFQDKVIYYLDAIARKMGVDVKIETTGLAAKNAGTGTESKDKSLKEKVKDKIKSKYTEIKEKVSGKIKDFVNAKTGKTIFDTKMSDDELYEKGYSKTPDGEWLDQNGDPLDPKEMIKAGVITKAIASGKKKVTNIKSKAKAKIKSVSTSAKNAVTKAMDKGESAILDKAGFVNLDPDLWADTETGEQYTTAEALKVAAKKTVINAAIKAKTTMVGETLSEEELNNLGYVQGNDGQWLNPQGEWIDASELPKTQGLVQKTATAVKDVKTSVVKKAKPALKKAKESAKRTVAQVAEKTSTAILDKSGFVQTDADQWTDTETGEQYSTKDALKAAAKKDATAIKNKVVETAVGRTFNEDELYEAGYSKDNDGTWYDQNGEVVEEKNLPKTQGLVQKGQEAMKTSSKKIQSTIKPIAKKASSKVKLAANKSVTSAISSTGLIELDPGIWYDPDTGEQYDKPADIAKVAMKKAGSNAKKSMKKFASDARTAVTDVATNAVNNATYKLQEFKEKRKARKQAKAEQWLGLDALESFDPDMSDPMTANYFGGRQPIIDAGKTSDKEKEEMTPFEKRMIELTEAQNGALEATQKATEKTAEETAKANEAPDKNGTIDEEGSAADQARDREEADAKRKKKIEEREEQRKKLLEKEKEKQAKKKNREELIKQAEKGKDGMSITDYLLLKLGITGKGGLIRKGKALGLGVMRKLGMKGAASAVAKGGVKGLAKFGIGKGIAGAKAGLGLAKVGLGKVAALAAANPAIAAALAGTALIAAGSKGWNDSKNLKKSFGGENATDAQKGASGLGGILNMASFGLLNKLGGRKHVDKFIANTNLGHFAGGVGSTLASIGGGIKTGIRAFQGKDAPMNDEELKSARAKLKANIKRGKPNAQKDLQEFEQAVKAEQWEKARSISDIHVNTLKETGKNLWRATKGIANIATFGMSGWLSEKLFGDNDKPMDEKELADARKKIAVMQKKNKPGAKNLAINFEEAVEGEHWATARKLIKAEDKGLISKLFSKFSVKAALTGAVLGGGVAGLAAGFLFGTNDDKPLSEKEIKDFQDRCGKSAKSGNKAAEKLLQKFNDAVEEQNWKLARKLSNKQDKSIASVLGGGLYKAFRVATPLGWFFSDQDEPMSEKEISDFRKKMEYLKSKGDTSAATKLEKFDVAVVKQDWALARKISEVKHESIMKRVDKALFNFFIGSEDEPMNEEEIKKFRDSMNRKIELGDQASKRRLEQFDDAIGRQNWRKARQIADKSNDGIFTAAAKGLVKGVGKGLYSLLLAPWIGDQDKPMTEEEVKKYKERMQGLIDQGDVVAKNKLAQFEDAVLDGNWKKARAISGIEDGPNNLVSKVSNWAVHLFDDKVKEVNEKETDESKVAQRYRLILQRVKEAINKPNIGFWGHHQLASLRNEMQDTDLTDLNDEKLDEWADQLKEIDKSCGDLSEEGAGAYESERKKKKKLLNQQQLLLKEIVASQERCGFFDWSKRSKLKKLFSEVEAISMEELEKDILDSYDEDLRTIDSKAMSTKQLDGTEKAKLQKLMKRQATLLGNIEEVRNNTSFFNVLKKSRLNKLTNEVQNCLIEETDDDDFDEWDAELKDIDETAHDSKQRSPAELKKIKALAKKRSKLRAMIEESKANAGFFEFSKKSGLGKILMDMDSVMDEELDDDTIKSWEDDYKAADENAKTVDEADADEKEHKQLLRDKRKLRSEVRKTIRRHRKDDPGFFETDIAAACQKLVNKLDAIADEDFTASDYDEAHSELEELDADAAKNVSRSETREEKDKHAEEAKSAQEKAAAEAKQAAANAVSDNTSGGGFLDAIKGWFTSKDEKPVANKLYEDKPQGTYTRYQKPMSSGIFDAIKDIGSRLKNIFTLHSSIDPEAAKNAAVKLSDGVITEKDINNHVDLYNKVRAGKASAGEIEKNAMQSQIDATNRIAAAAGKDAASAINADELARAGSGELQWHNAKTGADVLGKIRRTGANAAGIYGTAGAIGAGMAAGNALKEGSINDAANMAVTAGRMAEHGARHFVTGHVQGGLDVASQYAKGAPMAAAGYLNDLNNAILPSGAANVLNTVNNAVGTGIGTVLAAPADIGNKAIDVANSGLDAVSSGFGAGSDLLHKGFSKIGSWFKGSDDKEKKPLNSTFGWVKQGIRAINEKFGPSQEELDNENEALDNADLKRFADASGSDFVAVKRRRDQEISGDHTDVNLEQDLHVLEGNMVKPEVIARLKKMEEEGTLADHIAKIAKIGNEFNLLPGISADQAETYLMKCYDKNIKGASLHSSTLDVARSLANQSVETAISTDANNKITDVTKGDVFSVNAPMNKGGSVIHNHPDGSGTSVTDIDSAIDAGLSSLTTIRPKFNSGVVGKIAELEAQNRKYQLNSLYNEKSDTIELRPGIDLKKTDIGNAIVETVNLKNQSNEAKEKSDGQLNSIFSDLLSGVSSMGSSLDGIGGSSMSQGEILQGIFNKLDVIVNAINGHNEEVNATIGNSATQSFNLMKQYTNSKFEQKKQEQEPATSKPSAIQISKQ